MPLSRPGHEDISFWVNHNGLAELDVEGEVGFGDMARLLMRRRANAPNMRELRDRFVFRVQDFAQLATEDLFKVELAEDGWKWRHAPQRVVVGVGRTHNLPVVVTNRTQASRTVRVTLANSAAEATLAPGAACGLFLKVREADSGVFERRLSVSAGAVEGTAVWTVDARALGRLRVRLLESDGSPAAARVYLTAADGLGYAPPGSISRFAALPAEQFFHAQGSFELELPSGVTVVEATRGQEYYLARRELHLPPGRTTETQVTLTRWVHPAAEGWYSADAHIHANYTAPHHQSITPQDVRLQTLAEDLNNANLVVANSSGDFIHDDAFFEGRPHALSTPSHVMYWNEEMRNAGLYGHMAFFNLKSLVHPIYTGFANTPHWEDFPANYTQAKAARAQGGAVTYVHPGYAATMDGASARELPVDLALGEVDAIDVISNNPEDVATEIWYRLLNCGFRLAPSAGTDAFTNVADHYTPGGGRVYVRLNGGMRYADWIENYRRGRSFASNGPILSFTVDGREPGSELSFAGGEPRRLRVKASLRTLVPVDRFEIIVNGRAVISRSVTGLEKAGIDEEIVLQSGAWIAARATGPWHRLILNDSYAFAHTGPVYVSMGGRGAASAADAAFYADWIERLMDRTRQRGRFATPERREEVLALFGRARDIYRGLEKSAPAAAR